MLDVDIHVSRRRRQRQHGCHGDVPGVHGLRHGHGRGDGERGRHADPAAERADLAAEAALALMTTTPGAWRHAAGGNVVGGEQQRRRRGRERLHQLVDQLHGAAGCPVLPRRLQVDRHALEHR